ncbi:MOSC domain-containing protein [Lysobacter humi (ex Lee et al. 2017)]
MQIAGLYRYPLKSCAPAKVERLDIEHRGPAGDRRWLVIDADGRFVTARQHPRMVGILAEPGPDGLRLQADGMASLATGPATGPRRVVAIWKDRVDARAVSPEADAWLTAYLGFPVQLVHMDDEAARPVDPAYAHGGDEVSFADGYPVLLISQAALDGLNARLARPVPMTRFRPNIVVDGAAAHAEDGWRRVRIGAVEFDAVKPCTRCVFTTVDPASMTRDPDGEPLRTLTTYRRTPAGVTFGMNLIPRARGVLRVGDAVEVLA